MEVHRQYGKHGLRAPIRSQQVRVIAASTLSNLPDQPVAFVAAVQRPIPYIA
jgi:hypothetical protein